jgi:8-oxo-dGTP pyrophosphatase MutT (NUDIX family)
MPDFVPAIAHPAATVVLLRDGNDGCEVLLVRRNARLAFHGGAWVFPGGRIDPEDHAAAGSDDILVVARHGAVREAREEAGVVIERERLVLISRWITPEPLPKRFDTWFFAAPAGPEMAVQVDGGEIHEHRWFPIDEALAAQKAGKIELPPPTFVTILGLRVHPTVNEALQALSRRAPETFMPRLHGVPGGAITVYSGDAGYESGDVNRPGARHRLWMLESGWRYERTA